MHFQAPDNKGQHFLELCDDNIQSITLSVAKGGLWLKYFGHSNLLYIRASRAIVNHVPIGKYWLRFFPKDLIAHVALILLNYDDIYFISVKDTTIIGIQGEIQ